VDFIRLFDCINFIKMFDSGPAGSAQTSWEVHEREGKKGGLKDGERWPQAWTPKIYDRSPPLLLKCKFKRSPSTN